MPASRLKDPTTDWKARSTKKKLLGSAILLLSFAAQQFLFENWKAKSESLSTAILETAVIDKSTLLNEVLYFVAGSQPGTLGTQDIAAVRAAYIKEAARKIAVSQVMNIVGLTALDQQEKVERGNQLLAHAAAVSDFDSFLRYVAEINTDFRGYSELLQLQLQGISERARVARWIYLGLNILGSLCLLWGFSDDHRDAKAKH